jgi:Pregnancy-associated plasma protein-A
MNRITKFLTHAVLVCMFLCLSISAKSQYCQAPESAPYPAVPSCDSAGGEFIVRIYGHIVQRTNGTGGQSLSNINNALNILMDDFRPYDISFSLIGIDSIQVPDPIYNFSLGKDTVFQYNNHPDGIDIYFLGDTVYNNGVVDAIPGKNIALGGVIDGIPATDGSTLTHEMGHCLGLFHTFHGNCESGTPDLINTPNDDCIRGDFVKDTPPDICISWRCTDSSCDYFYTDNDCIAVSSAYPTEPGDPLNISNVFSILSVNYMSGSPPHRTKEFTQGQVNRMKYLLTDTLLFLQNVLDDTLRIGFKFTATTPKKCYGPILIEPGGKLVVDTTFSIIEDEYIIIKAGGRLIVNGGIINGCNDKYWHGIEVLGSKTNSQFPLSHHGYARFTNGATIEQAKFPVRAYGGGLVIGIDSEFKNCGAAQFFAYNYKRLSYFSDFNFIVDGNYGLSDFYTQTYLFGTNNVAFYKCLFSADLPSGFEASGNAIVSFDSKFKVTNSTIEGFHDGISAYYSGTSPFAATFSVERCTLKNNFNGISNWGVDDAIIRENTFTGIGNHPWYQTEPDTAHAGLVLNNCTDFVVEENSFTGSFTGATHTIGILTHNSGSQPTLIQLNRFDSLNVAEQAEKGNSDSFTGIGLQYWCNDNLGANTYDFFVAQGGNIAASQGGGAAARNRFSLNGNNPASDFDNEGGDDILYYYRDTLSERPDSIFGIELNLNKDGVICSGEGEEDPAPMPADTKDSLRQVFDENKSLSDSLQTVYAANLDGGDTEGLLSAAENVTQLTLGQVRQDLLTASPWVTAPVLQAVVSRQDVFLDATIYEVLSANPDEIRAPAMQSFLYSELSQGLADSIDGIRQPFGRSRQ